MSEEGQRLPQFLQITPLLVDHTGYFRLVNFQNRRKYSRRNLRRYSPQWLLLLLPLVDVVPLFALLVTLLCSSASTLPQRSYLAQIFISLRGWILDLPQIVPPRVVLKLLVELEVSL